MKFKTIFITFNIILLFSFLFIFFMPFVMLGWEYTRTFWGQNWYLAAAFVLVLAGPNAYFVKNWTLFTLLEAEDWHRIKLHLEDRIFNRKAVNGQNVRILINTYLVLSEIGGVLRLEEFLKTEKKRLHSAFGLELGLPYLVRNEPEAMEVYFSALVSDPGTKNRDWIRWNLVFARMMKKDFDPAKAELIALAKEAKHPVLKLLSLYLLDSFKSLDPAAASAVVEGKAGIRKRYGEKEWNAVLERSKTNLQVLVLMKLVKDATLWLFDENK